MIVTQTAAGYQFVTQPDHAALSGQLATHWGNDAFDRPAPRAAVCLAAEHHDHGWRSYDLVPHLTDDATPRGFIDVPGEEWVDFYARGIEAVAAADPYAGLLTSMHATGLRRGGYGVRPSIPDQSEDPPYGSFVAEQEQFQRDTLAELQDTDRYAAYATPDEREFLAGVHESGDPDGGDVAKADSRLWNNYLLIQTCDVLSLYFCGASSLHHERIEPIPTAHGSASASLTLDPIAPSAVGVEPFPFDTSPLAASVATRVVPNSEADGANTDLLDAYFRAERRPTEFTLY